MLKKIIKFLFICGLIVVGLVMKDIMLISYAQEQIEDFKELYWEKLSDELKCKKSLNKLSKELINLQNCFEDLEGYKKRVKALNEAVDYLNHNLQVKRNEYDIVAEEYNKQKKELIHYRNWIAIIGIGGFIIGFVIRNSI